MASTFKLKQIWGQGSQQSVQERGSPGTCKGVGKAKALACLQALGKLLWALAVSGLLSEDVAAALNVGSTPEEGQLDGQTAQRLAAAYLALPALVQRLSQPMLLQSLQARKDQLADASSRKVRGRLLLLKGQPKL